MHGIKLLYIHLHIYTKCTCIIIIITTKDWLFSMLDPHSTLYFFSFRTHTQTHIYTQQSCFVYTHDENDDDEHHHHQHADYWQLEIHFLVKERRSLSWYTMIGELHNKENLVKWTGTRRLNQNQQTLYSHC